MTERLLPRRRTDRRNPRRATVLDTEQIGAILGIDDVTR